MKIEIVELSSGFANIPNNFILAEKYGRNLAERSGSGYDVWHTVEVENAEIKTIYGEPTLFIDGTPCKDIYKTQKWWTFHLGNRKDVLVKAK